MMKQQPYAIRPPFRLLFDTFGGVAVSAMIICIISGVVLAIPYDVSDPYRSISGFLLTNPWAVIARNMHYWSAQAFLVFTILHMWDHFRIGSERGIRPGPWLRLVISVFVVFYAMLSGFILKGDADSRQALLIFGSLFEQLPLIGKQLAYVLLGSDDSMLLLYINHVAIATVFIVVVLFEHARIIWGKAITFIVTGLLMLMLSLLFQAPLHDGYSAVVKGPWYFLGLQEILHWMSRPVWIWVVVLVVALPVFVMPWLGERYAKRSKYFLFAALLFYAVLTTIGYFFRGAEWKWTWTGEGTHMPFNPVPIVPGTYADQKVFQVHGIGRAESCMLCHEGMTGFSPSHSPEAVGCVSCHLGNPFTPEKDLAHKGMLRVPGNLDNAARSCGTASCHPDITQRIQTTLMTTMSGIISVDRFVFNELEHPSGYFNVGDIAYSAADQHLRNLCTRCHLGNHKADPGPVTQESRGGGCNACHLNYGAEAARELLEYYGTIMSDSSHWKAHPSLDLNITGEHCFGCHSRSGRISTSYEGWHETLLRKDEILPSDTLRVLDDGRVFRYIAGDVHHQRGMQCIDCHDSYELMGDGNLYEHEEEQVVIGCGDCHFSSLPLMMTIADLDQETQKIMEMRGLSGAEGPFLPVGQTGRLLWNTVAGTEGDVMLRGKVDGRLHPLNPPAGICTRGDAHDRLSCDACHTAWVPQCIGCHNEYDPQTAGYDMIKQQEQQGSWVEYVGLYLAALPALGVVEEGAGRVHTFVPGMVLTINTDSYDAAAGGGKVFKRLYAPVSAHTTAAQGRSCRSCHNDPVALGYGHGKLTYDNVYGRGVWSFRPRFAPNPNDGLPEDAWIPFLEQPAGRLSTRTNTRPFSLEEQQRILLAGACLECHDEDSGIAMSMLDDLDALIEKRSPVCILPDYY
jgi:quinol-cytochrome oxidoreductase complex cytochrome b subunit